MKRGLAEMLIPQMKNSFLFTALNKLTCITITYHKVNDVVDKHILYVQRNEYEQILLIIHKLGCFSNLPQNSPMSLVISNTMQVLEG